MVFILFNSKVYICPSFLDSISTTRRLARPVFPVSLGGKVKGKARKLFKKNDEKKGVYGRDVSIKRET